MSDNDENREMREVNDGSRMETFLKDAAVQSAVKRVSDDYTAQWKAATTPAEREALWAKSRALDDLLLELQRVVDTGTRAAHNRTMRERANARSARPRT